MRRGVQGEEFPPLESIWNEKVVSPANFRVVDPLPVRGLGPFPVALQKVKCSLAMI